MLVSKSIDLGSNFLVASSAEVTATEDGPHVTIWSRVGDGPRTAVKLNEAQFKRVVSMFRAVKKEFEGGGMRSLLRFLASSGRTAGLANWKPSGRG